MQSQSIESQPVWAEQEEANMGEHDLLFIGCDVTPINDAIVSEDGSLLTELCEFIYKEPPLNPLMASFFSKTMAILISRKADKV